MQTQLEARLQGFLLFANTNSFFNLCTLVICTFCSEDTAKLYNY